MGAATVDVLPTVAASIGSGGPLPMRPASLAAAIAFSREPGRGATKPSSHQRWRGPTRDELPLRILGARLIETHAARGLARL